MANEFARQLRKNMTDAERYVWQRIRGRQMAGFRFRRQAPFDPYVADFVCHEAKLILELDGGQHAERIGHDATRTTFLAASGYRVLRVWNHEALTDWDTVSEWLYEALVTGAGKPDQGGEASLPGTNVSVRDAPPTPHPNPPPQGGREQSENTSDSVLIFGCGYLGKRAAAAWVAAGRQVWALTRSRDAELSAAGIEPIRGDVLDPASLRALPDAATILYAVGLDRSAGRSMRDVYVQGLANVLASVRPPRRFIYISSTSVYGDRGGEWVDEDGPADSDDESGAVVREAESLLKDAVVLRFAGIYGPGRVIGKAGLLDGQPVAGDPDRYLNLVHVEDGVRAVMRAEAKGTPGRTYNIADDEPVSRREYYTAAAEVLGAKVPTFVGDGGGANRRISNKRAKVELGFVPVYRSCRDGLMGSV